MSLCVPKDSGPSTTQSQKKNLEIYQHLTSSTPGTLIKLHDLFSQEGLRNLWGAETVSRYNYCTLSYLPDGQFLGVLLTLKFHEWGGEGGQLNPHSLNLTLYCLGMQEEWDPRQDFQKPDIFSQKLLQQWSCLYSVTIPSAFTYLVLSRLFWPWVSGPITKSFIHPSIYFLANHLLKLLTVPSKGMQGWAKKTESLPSKQYIKL